MDRIFNTLQLVVSGHSSRTHLNQLIEHCYKIAYSHCRIRQKRIEPVLKKSGYSMRDLSIDAISTLFIKNDAEEYPQLQRAFKAWQPPIISDCGADFFLHQIVMKKIDQQITSYLFENDHYFFKTHSALCYLLKTKNRTEFKRIYYLGTAYIAEYGFENISGKIADSALLSDIPISLLQLNDSLFSNIIDWIKSRGEYSPLIPFNDLIKRLLLVKNFSKVRLEFAENKIFTSDFSANIFLFESMELCKSVVKEKIANSYVRKKKLSRDEGSAFCKIIDDIGADLLDGGLDWNLYLYFKSHLPEVDESVYKFRYKSILEYVVRILRAEVTQQLIK